jgi:hypothetical protein
MTDVAAGPKVARSAGDNILVAAIQNRVQIVHMAHNMTQIFKHAESLFREVYNISLAAVAYSFLSTKLEC